MNYIKILDCNKKEYKLPYFKEEHSLLSFISSVTKVEIKNILDIKIVIDNEELEYNSKNYKELKRTNNTSFKETLDFFKDEFNTFSKVELLYKQSIDEKNIDIIGSISKLGKKKNDILNFRTIKIHKSNGKIKERYICSVKKEYDLYKKTYRDMKDLLEAGVSLEPEMLGLGKSVKDSTEYFNDFDNIVKIDFKDFFNQISYGKVLKGLKENFATDNDKVIKFIASIIAPYSSDKGRRATWQGLSTSTIGAYIALLSTFKKVKKYLQDNYGITPTIYIDDLTFGVQGDIKIANRIKKEVMKIIIDEGFYLNFDKCKTLFGNKTFFLGINMKTKRLGTNSYVKNLKAALNNFFYGDKTYKNENRMKVIGKLSYLKMISMEHFNQLNTHHKYSKFISEVMYKKAVNI